MADFTVLVTFNDEDMLVIDKKKLLKIKNIVVSKSKLHLDNLHDSQVTYLLRGSFSDRMSKLLTGEDGEEAVLARYELSEEQTENFKKIF